LRIGQALVSEGVHQDVNRFHLRLHHYGRSELFV
jgi:hypothetical protein